MPGLQIQGCEGLLRSPPRPAQTGRKGGACAWLLEPAAAVLKYSSHIAVGGDAVPRCIVTEGESHFVCEMLILHTQGTHKGTLVGQVQINT